MALTKPLVDSATWGNTNITSPDMVIPGAGLINTGFLAPPTLPKRGHINWLLNKLHQGIRYAMAQGIPAWDASETNYAVGSVVMVGNLGYVLNTGSATTGLSPASDLTHWGLLVPVQPGTLLRRVRLTTGSTASTAGCKLARLLGVGGGGGGAGAAGNSNPNSLGGGGGGAGAWAEFSTTVIPVTWSYVSGAGGGGGAPPGTALTLTAGSNGADSTFSDGTNTFTCPGGLGADAVYNGGAGGAAPSASPGGTILRSSLGQDGGSGDNSGSAPICPIRAGDGGSGPLGFGGRGLSSTAALAAGQTGRGFGSGGSGAMAGVTARGGGSGSTGSWILEEWA